MVNDFVAYSRAGDVFHYRWAARRCLHMIYPNNSLQYLIVEGSDEIEKAGEYTNDITEYHLIDNEKHIYYFQLKHSTTQVNNPFTISDLKETFKGFSERFIQHYGINIESINAKKIQFIILTNRIINYDFKQNIQEIALGNAVNNIFKKTIEKYTSLKGDKLKAFCKILRFEYVTENYLGQKNELQTEIAQLIAGSVNTVILDSLTTLVQERVLPDANHKIIKEEILQKFGITSERQLYPAPPVWEKDFHILFREEYRILKNEILSNIGPFIIHASGGVGKSVFCRHLASDLDDDSLAIVFDCFGAGNYRNPSTIRHGYRNALIQICNELATRGLCMPLLLHNDSDEIITQAFIQRIEKSLSSLKLVNPSAKLLLIIDAADNAEMAAKEFNQNCFAHGILRESYPQDFKLVLTCRTERITLLQPQSKVVQLVLSPFSVTESFENLKNYFPHATQMDGNEFHRLTSGNPRVQANALESEVKSVAELWNILGPATITVEGLIELKLQNAVNKMKDNLPNEFNKHIQAIGIGLSSLPPNIPLKVLSAASDVDVELIKSFVSDIGKSLWLSDESVQFRDEPTETWFRSHFIGNANNYKTYITKLEGLANTITYVAEVLPKLYLQAGEYDKLITLSLSDNLLPKNNPIDERNVRVYRLKFAFQAALKLSQFEDAIKIAMRAGEEVAGDQRQLNLLKNNIDLLAKLQSKEKVQQIAYNRLLCGIWPGAENIYSASVLSFIPEFGGEARSYARSSTDWLYLYFNDIKKQKELLGEDNLHKRVENNVQDEDIFELAFAILNINSSNDCFLFLSGFKPKSFIAKIFGKIVSRLIDHGRFAEIDQFLELTYKIPEFFITITDELVKAGRLPGVTGFESVLTLLAHKKTRIEQVKNHFNDDSQVSQIISFLEVCILHKMPKKLILRVLRNYVPYQISKEEVNFHISTLRIKFFRALAIRSLLEESFELNTHNFLLKRGDFEKGDYKEELDLKDYQQVFLALFPWFSLRIKVFNGEDFDFLFEASAAAESSKKVTNSRYKSNDFLSKELITLYVSVLAIYHKATTAVVNSFYEKYIKNSKYFDINQALDFARIVFRNNHLSCLKGIIETRSRQDIITKFDYSPEEISNQYIKLAKAVIIDSIEDASVYFDEAVKSVSKFGDEVLKRWCAIASLGKKGASTGEESNEIAYRFIRCAEAVGKNAREKYWDRNEALTICIRLSSPIGIAALSRWRDRHIGNFDYLLRSALRELISLNKITPAISWSFSKILLNSVNIEFVTYHLNNTNDRHIKQHIFNDALELFGKQGNLAYCYFEFENLAIEHNLKIDPFIQNIFANAGTNSKIKNKGKLNSELQSKVPVDWESIFENIDLTNIEGLNESYKRFQSINTNITQDDFRNFCLNTFQRCSENDISKIIKVYLSSDFVYYSKVPVFFSAFPESWSNKISFKKNRQNILRDLGKKFAFDIISDYAFNSFCKELKLHEEEIEILKSGIFDGFAENLNQEDAEFFFDFVSLASTTVNKKQALSLLDYSLSRFELHIDDDFGDGPWAEWLHPDDDINYNLAGFLWSVLGSPDATSRWQAAHSLMWLASINAQQVFDYLIRWMKKGTIDSFGGRGLVFYNLHARLYSLFAYAKIAKFFPQILISYKKEFYFYAFEQHHLIQITCSEIIFSLNSSLPETYTSEEISNINKVVNSPFSKKKVKYGFKTHNYQYIEGKESHNGEFFFGIDFPHYWYAPLGYVFGVPQNEVCEVANELIVSEWNVNVNGWHQDPRRSFWNNHLREMSTWHSHGNYPKVDTLDFYYSYHAMFVMAARFLQNMPIVYRNDDSENHWQEWVSRHSLTFNDGKWLGDYRGFAPFQRPGWVEDKPVDKWKEKIANTNLIESIIFPEDNQQFMVINGSWHESQDYQKETYHASSALVNPLTSLALLNALTTCKDSWDYEIPSYNEEDAEYKFNNFELKGWIYSPYLNKGIDQFDIEAHEITHLYNEIGSKYQKILGLKSENEGQIWFSPNNRKPVIKSEIYCSALRVSADDEPAQRGNRTKASINYLIEICHTLNYDIIFEVRVSRNYIYSVRNDEKRMEKTELFLLKGDGTIRTSKKSYKLE